MPETTTRITHHQKHMEATIKIPPVPPPPPHISMNRLILKDPLEPTTTTTLQIRTATTKRILPKQWLQTMGNNLGKTKSKSKSQPFVFVVTGQNILAAQESVTTTTASLKSHSGRNLKNGIVKCVRPQTIDRKMGNHECFLTHPLIKSTQRFVHPDIPYPVSSTMTTCAATGSTAWIHPSLAEILFTSGTIVRQGMGQRWRGIIIETAVELLHGNNIINLLTNQGQETVTLVLPQTIQPTKGHQAAWQPVRVTMDCQLSSRITNEKDFKVLQILRKLGWKCSGGDGQIVKDRRDIKIRDRGL